MNSLFALTIIFVLGVVNILNSDAAGICSCSCCAGVGCKPTVQGTIDVESCTDSTWETLCRDKYPRNCSNGSDVSSIKCSKESTSPANKPNWIGSFRFVGNCQQETCCCPVGQLLVSNVSYNIVEIRFSRAGAYCPSELPPFARNITIPTGFTTSIFVESVYFPVTLSDDSNTIQIDDQWFPSCSETAKRNQCVSSRKISVSLLCFLVTLVIMKEVMI